MNLHCIGNVLFLNLNDKAEDNFHLCIVLSLTSSNENKMQPATNKIKEFIFRLKSISGTVN